MKRNPRDILFVGTQLILFVAYLFRFSKIDFSIPGWLQAAGLFISFTSIIIALASMITLNKNLSPFPTPRQRATLIQSGYTNTYVILFIQVSYFLLLVFRCIPKTLYGF